MTSEIINWELEAKRVGLAFGLTWPCWFVRYGDANKTYQLITTKSGEWHELIGQDEIQLHIRYTKDGRWYYLKDSSQQSLMRFCRQLNHFTYSAIPFLPDHSKIFVRALFKLDLLTPQVEECLGITISTHEKLEWTLEYEQRYGV